MALLQNLQRFFAEPAAESSIGLLYRACVAQARETAFYASLKVPDTVDGRFDLLLLHVVLVMRRLGDATARQQLFDLMFVDMDQNLREMGVGDMSIGKKMKVMIAAFYGRAQAYEKALAEDDAALTAVLVRNLYGTVQPAPDVTTSITAYVRRAVAALDRQSPEDLIAGRVEFAKPV
jgi:cytochrome b pre-mRNA-processing protein 3